MAVKAVGIEVKTFKIEKKDFNTLLEKSHVSIFKNYVDFYSKKMLKFVVATLISRIMIKMWTLDLRSNIYFTEAYTEINLANLQVHIMMFP